MKKHTARLIDTIAPREAVLLNCASTEAILICVLGLFAAMFVNASAAAQSAQAGESRQPQLMDREKEIALALSACPPSVASKAAVYALEKTGYIKVRDSENGFTAIVQHVRPNSQEPQCLDAEGARAFSATHPEGGRAAHSGQDSAGDPGLFIGRSRERHFFDADTTGGHLHALG